VASIATHIKIGLLTTTAKNIANKNKLSKINDVKGNNELNSYQKWDRISTILEEMYNGMGKSEREELIEDIRYKVKHLVIKSDPRSWADTNQIKNDIRDKIGQFLFSKTEKRPMVLPVVIEV